MVGERLGWAYGELGELTWEMLFSVGRPASVSAAIWMRQLKKCWWIGATSPGASVVPARRHRPNAQLSRLFAQLGGSCGDPRARRQPATRIATPVRAPTVSSVLTQASSIKPLARAMMSVEHCVWSQRQPTPANVMLPHP